MDRICNTLNDLSSKLCIPNKTEDLNLGVFNIITGINESKILSKDVWCKCECKFGNRRCNSNQNWNNGNCWCKCKNKKKTSCAQNRLFSWNLATCSCENGKYVWSNIFDSVISPNEIIDETKTVPTNFNKKGKL